MKKSEILIRDARKIIKKELLTCSYNTSLSSKASKKFRRFFMSACEEQIGAPFTSRITDNVAPEDVATQHQGLALS
jgi:SET domain-containing protein